jgi:hypothetical protein
VSTLNAKNTRGIPINCVASNNQQAAAAQGRNHGKHQNQRGSGFATNPSQNIRNGENEVIEIDSDNDDEIPMAVSSRRSASAASTSSARNTRDIPRNCVANSQQDAACDISPCSTEYGTRHVCD